MNNNNFKGDAALQRPQVNLSERKATVGKLSLFLEDYMVGDPHKTMKALEMASRFEQRIFDTTSTREQYLGMIASRMQYIQMRKQNLPGELETPAVHTEGEKSAIRQLLTANEPWLQRMSQLLANFSKSVPNNSEILSRYESYRRLLNRQCDMVLRENTFTMNYQGIRNLIDHIQRMTGVLEAKIPPNRPSSPSNTSQGQEQQQRKGSFERKQQGDGVTSQPSTKISSIPTEYEDELLKRLQEGNEDLASKLVEAPIRSDMTAIGIAILRKEIEQIRSRYDCFDAILLDTTSPKTRILLKMRSSSEWTCLAVPDDYPSTNGFQVIFGEKEFNPDGLIPPITLTLLIRHFIHKRQIVIVLFDMEDRLADVICKFHSLANTIYSLEDGGRQQVQTLLEEVVSQLQGLDEYLQSPESPKPLVPKDILAAIDQGRHPDFQWFLQDQLEDPERGLFAAHQRVLGKANALRQFRQLLLKETIGDEPNNNVPKSTEEVLNITD